MRNEKIEGVLAAWWDRDYGEVSRRAEAQLRLNQVLDDLLEDQSFTREEVLDHLYSRYVDYCRSRRREEKVQIAQKMQSGPQ